MHSVLIIDDEEVDFLIHSKIIKKGNFAEKVVYQSSGTAALLYVKHLLTTSEDWPTHIFVDINMPDMSGFQFLEAYQKIDGVEKYQPKIFILSSSDSSQDKVRAREMAFITEYLVKPLTLDTARRIFGS